MVASEQLTSRIIVGDCVSIPLADKSVNLTLCSPPYEDARTYGIDFNLRGQDWVDWAVARFMECLRVTDGLVAWVIEGKTKQYRWSATPALFMADLHRRGVHLRKPPIYRRVGIPGGGGPDWLRNDYEFVVCGTNGGRLRWSDNTAMGQPSKYATGGALSYRTSDGQRINSVKHADGSGKPNNRSQARPTIANPGNVIRERYTADEVAAMLDYAGDVVDCKVGGGLMGHELAHENEAPFPESLAEFFVRSFCPPGGTVLDCFCGSGTTLAVAKKTGRHGIGMDIRDSQRDLTERRLATIQEDQWQPTNN